MTSTPIYAHSDFIDNKYSRLYYRIINNARNRVEHFAYTETHHIIPRSMGGSDTQENLVELTAREHFMCHYLLSKFTVNNGKRSMFLAFMFMKANSNGRKYFNSRLYESVRLEFLSQQVGRTVSEETRAKMSAAQIGKKHSAETIKKISDAAKARKMSDDTKAKISESKLGVKKSEETRLKMSKAKTGVRRPNYSRRKCAPVG